MLTQRIATETGLAIESIGRLVRSASHRYKVYEIPKRDGRGTRVIEQPSRELKVLQLWLVARIFDRLPVHDSVFSYRRDLNIGAHALRHVHNNFLLRIDFKDFFPSIKDDDVLHLLVSQKHLIPIDLLPDDIRMIGKIVTRQGRLTIGAPSSPAISNAILYDFDAYWSNHAAQQGITYSRYADDLYFSTSHPNILSALPKEVDRSLATLRWPRLTINQAKTVYTSRKRQRVVTGLMLTSDWKVSVGHKQKRFIKSMVYRFKLGLLDSEEEAHLRGYLSFVRSVEPGFLLALTAKFGSQVLSQLGVSV